MIVSRESRTTPSVSRLLKPRSVAIVGASPEPRSFGGFVLANLENFGYRGDIHLVNRSRTHIQGRRCVPSVADLPHGVDVVVVAIPEAAVVDTVRACGERSANAAVIFSSGFAESGDAGRTRQELLATVAGEAGLAIVGPNCMGLTNFIDGVPLTFEPIEPLPRCDGQGIGIVAQSGAMAATIRDVLAGKGLPITYAISTGNEATLGAEDFLAHLIEDESTAVVGMYLEQIRRPRRFLELAAAARGAGKPVVLLVPGKSDRAREAAQSHTGALAGDYAVMRTLLESEGVVIVETLDELFDTVAILSRFPNPPASGPAFMTMSGALKNIALDQCDALGLAFPALSATTGAALRELLPAYATIDNPLDVTTVHVGSPEVPGLVATRLLDDENIGSLIVSQVAGSRLSQLDRARHLVPALGGTAKPVALVIMGDQSPLPEELTDAVRASRVPLFRSQDRALRAMAHVTAYARALERARSAPARLEIRAGALPGAGTVAEYQGKQWLAAAGMTIPAGRLAGDVDEATRIAAEIGYPVVIKAQADALPHKSDVGGVIVALVDEAALRRGWEQLHTNLAQARPDLVLDGVLVETMAEKGLELVVGARRDPDWGPVVMVGLGGVWIEALKDVRLLPPDLGEAQIVEELHHLKGAALLRGLRGSPAVDVRKVAAAVAVVGALMRTNPEVTEIDINPLVAYPDRVVVLDALVVCGPLRTLPLEEAL
ncbi:Organic acid-CoA ligase (ADP forming) similar to feruloyl-CoA synthetase [Aromatoleum aromaticum EbN1]|uniref:Organic acid-CoA ligase (ADP forming) similar to feruloyl-CoA synthetase n=1 Tax=Aromatoleum aromaticum (strain DSM 19018 / LMG 30748 / EbN1) TaxID=76114 RepID=Q5P019_AROAE|nr:acetate--CoA ligase family protein [Aromatoleum aromaticum]CAI09345.1 Organic acid-CoA ligase (ADP forming) similar to feruloyl-CoA synthetase [Aromatoleum aromaticum EbN1]